MADETKKTSRYEEEIPEFDRTKLKNADLNISQYGDDSSAKYYEDPTLWGGENAKYEGEGVKNTLVAYNPDATLDNLGEYKYGQAAQMANSEQANYITNRNDQIASALYNAGLTSRDDVANYLSGQEGWNYSTEDERQNTINSIWKRLGSIASENDKSNTQDNEKDKQAEAVARMESDLSNNGGVIYGKVTGEKGNPVNGIETAVDENAVLNKRVEDRLSDLKALMTMSSSAIAASEISGTMPYGETAMRDLAQYYPEKYAEIQAEKKKILAQMNVNAITNGEGINTVADTVDTNTQNTSYAVNNSSLSVSATQLLQAIDSHLESNDAAKSANELMGSIENDMSKLKNRLQNLKQEANQIFKGDVPDYIVKAYMNNKSQEIQNQLSILEDRYNAAYSRWRDEVSDAQWEEEMKLKQDAQALEWYKAENSGDSTTSTTDKNYTVAERNNNPTNMTVGFMERAGAELGVDYEISPDSFWSDGKQLYYAKLLGDPLDTTIKVIDKAIANGKNPFNTTSWSYMNQLGMTVDKWNKMSDEDKKKFITNQWLPREGGNIENMKYYVNNPGISYQTDTSGYGYKGFEYGFDNRLEPLFKAYIESGKLGGNSGTYNQIKNLTGYSDQEIGIQLGYWMKYNQNQFNSAGINVLEALAAFWLAADTKEVKDGDGNTETVFNKTWIWDYGIGGGDARAALEDIFNEKLLQRYVEARQRGVSFGSTTEAEWDIMKATNRLQKNVKFSSSDEDFTDAYKDLLQGVWEETFHTKYNESDWLQYLQDMQEGRTNINVALLTNNTSGVEEQQKNVNDAMDETAKQFSGGYNTGQGQFDVSNL